MLIYFVHVISDLEMKKIIRNNFVDHIITRCAVFIYLESTTNKVLELYLIFVPALFGYYLW